MTPLQKVAALLLLLEKLLTQDDPKRIGEVARGWLNQAGP